MAKILFFSISILVLSVPAFGAWPHGGEGQHADCAACHSAHEAVGSALLRGGAAICESCHDYQDPVGLWPGIDGYEQSAHVGLCTGCHSPHGVTDERGPIPHLAVKRGTNLCLDCHAEIANELASSKEFEAVAGMPSRHHVDQAGSGVSCVDCHNPHVVEHSREGLEPRVTNPNDPLQKVALQNRVVINKFCITCHNGSRDQAPDILGEINGLEAASGFKPVLQQESLHAVHLTKTHKQNCLQCHEPHANTGNAGVNRGRLLYDLKITYYNQGYPGYNSCETSCHGVRCGSCHPQPPLVDSP